MFDFDKEISNIGGWLTEKEGLYLYNLTSKLSENGVVVEIGSWKGRSTICLGKGAKNIPGVKVYAIDPHTGSSEHLRWFGKVNTFPVFQENVKNASLESIVYPIKLTSKEALNNFKDSIDFLFIDGAHDFQNVNFDYKNWTSKLKIGGILGFHDCWHAIGVQFVSSKALIFDNFINPKLIDTLTVMEQTEEVKFGNRVWNILFIIFRFLFGWIGTIKMNYLGGYVEK
jgi:hypothetical protein